MKWLSLIAAAAFAMTTAAPVNAQQIGPAPAGCWKDMNGLVSCPPLGGAISVTLSGQAICGKGRCIRDIYGKVTCSALPGGQITSDPMGRIACAGSCEEASAAYCQQLQ